MQKQKLRTTYLNKRTVFSNNEIDTLSLQLANQCLSLPIWQFTTYHLFLSIMEKKEVNTQYILHILQGKDKNIVVPKMNPTTQELDHYLLTDNTLLKKNKWNIPEPINGISVSPKNIDVIFVPLLAFDTQGNRLGYGKGFYDKFFQQCKEHCLKIGLSLFEPHKETLPTQAHDIALDFCVTPQKIYQFKH